MNNDDLFTSFQCDHCHTEIEASLDMVGENTECPACGANLVVPQPEDAHIDRHTTDEDLKGKTQAIKSRTIRIELGDL